jgi:hypothetical protein
MWRVVILAAVFFPLSLGCGDAGKDPASKRSPPDSQEAERSASPIAKSPIPGGEDWVDAQSKEIRHGDVKLQVHAVEIGPVKMQAKAGEGEFSPTQENYLVVGITLTNTGEKQKREYTGWGSFATELNGNPPKLIDSQGRDYKLVTFGQNAAIEGRLNSVNLVRGQSKRDVLIFARPPDDVEVVYLTLPGENIGEKEPIRLRLAIAR